MKIANPLFSLLTAMVSSALPSNLCAQAGSLDADFDGDGIVTTDIAVGYDRGQDMAVQPDGKIVVTGYVDNGTNEEFAVVRYTADGVLDTSFSADGKVTTAFGLYDATAFAIALQPDGKIVVAGHAYDGADWDFALVRYHADGSIDTDFGINGKRTTDFGSNDDRAYGVAIQPDGKIVVNGSSLAPMSNVWAVARYLPDGTPDNSFSGDGKLTTVINSTGDSSQSLALQPDAKIVVIGYSHDSGGNTVFALARYNTDGTPDNGFDMNGKLITAFGSHAVGTSVAIQPDGKIVAAGYCLDGAAPDFALARYNTDGSLDTSFSADGKVVTAYGPYDDRIYSMVLQPDGRIVGAGYANNGFNEDVAVVRYNADGTLDNSFSADGVVTTDIADSTDRSHAVALQPDGKIVAAGYMFNGAYDDFAVVRYLSDLNVGLITSSGPGTSILVYPNPIGEHATLQYALAKEERITIQLLDAAGSVVYTFMENRVQSAGEHQQTMNLPPLASGSYIVVIASTEGKVSIRVVK